MFGAEDRLFTKRRIRLYAVSVAVAIAAVSAWEFLHGRSVIDPAGKPVCIDFCAIWVTRNFASSSEPIRADDYPVFSAARASAACAD
jgi:hypothetical protein